MTAEVFSEFSGFQTSALADINDLFFLSNDPLPQRDLVSLRFVAVPEPSIAHLVPMSLTVFVLASNNKRLLGFGGARFRSLRTPGH
jgi:hypothetical protein